VIVKRFLVLIIVVSLWVPTYVCAQSPFSNVLPLWPSDESLSEKLGGVDVQLAAYLWTMGLEGTVGVRGVTTSIDVGFDELLKMLNMGVFAFAEIRKDEFALLSDFMYSELADRVEPSPLLTIDSKIKLVAGDVVFSYQVAPRPESIEFFAGARYMSMSMDVDISSPIPILNRRGEGSQRWVDPVVGTRLILDLSPKTSFVLRGDIGGFGVSSELLWQVIAGFRYRLRDNISMGVVYRVLDYDYTNDGFVLDTAMSGLGLALGISF
jgi:hypothetical protein